MKQNDQSSASRLRQKAEELLKEKSLPMDALLSDAKSKALIHELQVHQVELEMQNEELILAREESEAARRKYTELYDFAPTGYFTLSRGGEILELNLCASQMIGKERIYLKNCLLAVFISDNTKLQFNLFLEKVFKSNSKQSCEVTMAVNERTPIIVQLDGIVSENLEHCLLTALDITERKRIGEMISESERFLKDIQMIARLGAFSIDLLNNRWTSSEVLNQIFGIDNDYDKSLKGWISVVHPDWQQIMSDYFHETAVSNLEMNKEYKIIRQDDHAERWIHVVGRIELDDFKKPRLLVGAIGDITERKEAEIALGNSRELYADLVSNQSAGFYRLRVKKDDPGISLLELTSLEFVSDRFCELFEFDKNEFLSDPINLALSRIHPDDLPEFIRLNKESRRLIRPFNGEARLLIDNRIKWVRFESIPRKLEDESTLWTGLLLEITEQKLADEISRKNEERYRMLLELATDAFYHGDENGDFISVNSVAIEQTGFSREELLMMNMKDLFSFETLTNQPLKYDQIIKGEIILSEREMIRKDSTPKIVEMKSRMMPDGTFQSFIRDITERKRIEQALRQKVHELEIYYELAITRERKMINLKSEINLLLERLGEDLKY